MDVSSRKAVPRSLSRPRILGGVSFPILIINLAVTAEAFLVTGSLLALPIALVTQVGGNLAYLRGRRFSGFRLMHGRRDPGVGDQKAISRSIGGFVG